MTITRLQMSIMLLVALALHGSIALWSVLSTPAPLEKPRMQPVRISLAATIADTTTQAAPIPEPVKPPEPIAKPTPPPPPKPTPKPLPKPVPKPAPKPLPKPVVKEPPPAPEPPKEPLPEPPPEPQPVKKSAEPTPEPVPEPTPPAMPSNAPLDAIATAKYEQLMVAWLQKHKKYPRRAKRLRIEGEGALRILIDRTGQTQDVALEQRTGNRLLDKAALAMAQRANPFPPLPESDPRQELEVIIPVAFLLR